VRRACIDIGSNTTRLLVADCDGVALREVHQERTFNHIGRELRAAHTISAPKIAEVTEEVRAQLARARALGAADVQAVATAAVRRAANGSALVESIRAACGLEVRILSGDDEARLAFLGASGTLDHAPAGAFGVVDVGGGSSELVVGQVPAAVSWSRSFAFGSADIADGCLHSDPPTSAEMGAARARVEHELADCKAPHPVEAVAVGGSTTSLRRVAGATLDGRTFARSIELLTSQPAAEIAGRYMLDRERVRLLPAGLLILEAASRLFGTPLHIGHGGVREGVLLEGEG
jgi:exopolyphosphatase / guanosine-5'-triphosphate,3'-diphosphate pyrophosphatase